MTMGTPSAAPSVHATRGCRLIGPNILRAPLARWDMAAKVPAARARTVRTMDARGRRYGRGRIWRRRLLAIAALAIVGIVAWRLIDATLGPDTEGATVEHLTIKSQAVGRKRPVTVVLPPGDEEREPRPMLVFLHGRVSSQDSALSDEFFAALAKAGSGAPIVALPYGGDHSYWHNRASGDWASYVVDEVIP